MIPKAQITNFGMLAQSLMRFISIVSLLGFVVYLIVRIQLIYFYGLSIGALENNVIYGIQKLMLGQPLYGNPELPPFDLIQKSPAYYFIVARLAQGFALSEEEPIAIFRLSRWFSLILNLGSALFIYLIQVQSFKVKKLLAAIFAMFLVANFTDHYYSRMDALYIFLFSIINYLFIRQLSVSKHKPFLVIGMLLSFLFFSKQNGAILAPVLGLFLLWQGQIKSIGFCVLGGLIGLLLGWWAFDLQWNSFYQNVFLGIQNGIDWSSWKRLGRSEVQMAWFGICFVVLGLTARFREKPAKFIALLGAFYFLFGGISMLKVASGLNYFTELKFFVILGIGWLWSKAKVESDKWYSILMISMILGLSLIINLKDLNLNIGHLYLNQPIQYEQSRQLAKWAKTHLPIEDSSYFFLGEEDFITHFLPKKVLLPIRSTTDEIIKTTSPAIDYTLLYQEMNRGLVSYIISRKDHLEEIKCLNRPFTNFNYLNTKFGYYIYRFTPPGMPSSPTR